MDGCRLLGIGELLILLRKISSSVIVFVGEGHFNDNLAVAEVKNGDAAEDHAQANELVSGKGFMKEDARPEQGPNIAKGNHRIENCQLTFANTS